MATVKVQFVILAFFGLFFIGKGQSILTGKAIKVYDGDTFTLLQDDGTETKIRLTGIDAPEIDQPFGKESRDYAISLLSGTKITVYTEPGETYNRKLGVVITSDGLHLNYELVQSGHAWFYEYYSDDKFLKAAQELARSEGKGLWGSAESIAPWDWRRNKR